MAAGQINSMEVDITVAFQRTPGHDPTEFVMMDITGRDGSYDFEIYPDRDDDTFTVRKAVRSGTQGAWIVETCFNKWEKISVGFQLDTEMGEKKIIILRGGELTFQSMDQATESTLNVAVKTFQRHLGNEAVSFFLSGGLECRVRLDRPTIQGQTKLWVLQIFLVESGV